jgi:hypothetical protein
MRKVSEQLAFAWELNHRLHVVPGSIRHGGSISSQTTSWKEAVVRSTKTVAFFPGETKFDSIRCSTCGKEVEISGKHFNFRRTILEALQYTAAFVFLPFTPLGLGVIYLAVKAGDNVLPLFPGRPWLSFSAAVGAIFSLCFACCLAWFQVSRLGSVECNTLYRDRLHIFKCKRL